MNINGLQAHIHLPIAPKGEGVHSLPPALVQEVYKVDDYPACPSNWMHGSGKASSYFLPVKEGRHMWLDFNSNWYHQHHIAIVLSVQGINPITGLPTRSLRLEQYRDKCIIHGTEFKGDRVCESCHNNAAGSYDGKIVSNFPGKWPPQNYMTTANHRHGYLWIDGWRADDGTIRGFLITSETMRGVAQQIIGEERVWAIGIAFYLSKEPKPAPAPPIMRSNFKIGATYKAQQQDCFYTSSSVSVNSTDDMARLRTALYTPEAHHLSSMQQSPSREILPSMLDTNLVQGASFDAPVAEVEVQKLEIGAGAKIQQELCYLDPNDPSFYKDEPEGLIYINYCSQSDFDKIISAGKADYTKGGEGFLSGLKTGN